MYLEEMCIRRLTVVVLQKVNVHIEDFKIDKSYYNILYSKINYLPFQTFKSTLDTQFSQIMVNLNK